jgi:hypothetical protein
VREFILSLKDHQRRQVLGVDWWVANSLHDKWQSSDMVEVTVSDNHGPDFVFSFLQILRVWQLAYLRDPTPAELALATDFVETQIETLEANPAAVPAGRTVTRQAMTNLSQALLSSNEFLYVE